MCIINLPIVKLMHNISYLMITYLQRVHNYLGKSKGSVSYVHWSDGFGILISLPSSGRKNLCWDLFFQKMLSNEELLIILKQQINFDRDQKAAAIDQTTGHEQLVDHNQLLGHLWYNIFETCYLPMSLHHSINLYKLYPPGSPNSCSHLKFLCHADPKYFSFLSWVLGMTLLLH